MYEKRLTFSWNRQPSHLKGEPACLSVFQVSKHLPDGGERLIYSKWLLVGEIGGQLWAYSLLRPDTQSHKEMLCLAAGTHAPKELEELNLSKQLLWE